MNEQLRFHADALVITRRSGPTTATRRLDDRTLEIGRRGIAEARSILAAHRQPDQNPTTPVQVSRAA